MAPNSVLFTGGPASRTRARRGATTSPTAATSSARATEAGPSDSAGVSDTNVDATMTDGPAVGGIEESLPVSQERDVPSSPSSIGASIDGDMDERCERAWRITLTDLPSEIIDHICTNIDDRADLVSLCLVNSFVRDFASRALFREPKITSRHVAWKLRSATRARKSLVTQIKVLDLDLVDLCHASLWASWHLQETGSVILDIMRYCHQLAHFRAQMPPESAMFWSDFAAVVGGSFRVLQSFYKDIRITHEPFWDFEHYAAQPAAWISMPDLMTCIQHHSNLHTLAVRGLGSALASRPVSQRPTCIAGRLRTLIIVQTSIKERDLLLLMGNTSSVTKLTLIESTCISKRGLVDALSSCGASLEELTVGPGWWGKSDTSFPIDDIAPKLRNLRRLTVEGDIISPAFFGTTHSHPGHHVRLDSLIVRRCHVFRPEMVLQALRDMTRAVNPPRGNGPAWNKRASGMAEVVPIQHVYMTHAAKNGWAAGDLREAQRVLRPGLLTHDIGDMDEEEPEP